MTLLRALRHPNYRLFFAGQGISLIGTWLTRFAMGYETYELSHSAFQLGLVAFFSQAPTALIAPLAGAYVDRWNRHRTLVVTQVFAMLQSVALAAFALTDTMTVWHLMGLGGVQAVINAFDMPARQSFVRQMVDDRADLPNAIALNSALVNSARLLGPAIAAVLVALVGVGWCFAGDAASYVAVVASLLAMRVAPQPARHRETAILDDMIDGWRYVARHRLVRALIALLAVTSVFGGAYSALLPAVAEGTLHGGADSLGILMGCAGAGALLAVLWLASRRGTQGLGRVICDAGLACGAALIALETAPSVWVAAPIMLVVGGGLILLWSTTNTLVQTNVDDDKLGRVMSLYAMAFFTGAPVGALLLGTIASWLGPVNALACGGVGCVVGALAFRRTIVTAG